MICKKCKKEIPDTSAYCNLCGARQQSPEKTPKLRGNGQGSVYKRNGKWAAAITRYNRGIRTTKTKSGFAKKSDALDWIAEAKQNRARHVTTLNALYDVYSETAMEKLSGSKQTAYKIAWKRIADIANDPVADLTIGDLQACIEGLNYYPARDVKTLLSHLYKRACAQGDAPSNLSEYLTLPDLQETESEPYTKDELTKIWNAYLGGETFAGYMLVMIYSGMMPGELLSCKKAMIDLKAQTIIGCGKKTKERRKRPIVFPVFITPVIEQLLRSAKSSENLVAMNKDNFYKNYHKIQITIGIRDLEPYSCRHTTATALALGDAAAPAIIARVMRQTRPITTQRYSHADVQTVRDVVDGMSDNPLAAPPQTIN